MGRTALHGSRLDDFARRYLTPRVLDFATGAPTLAAPREFRIQAARSMAAGCQGYADSAGRPPLRLALADDLAQRGFHVDPTDGLVITTGATGGLQAAVMTVVEPGDEILVPVPGYEPIFDIVRLAGARSVPVRLEAPTWELQEQTLKRALTARTKAIYFNQPANPTGRIFTPSEIETIIVLCQMHDLVLIEDSVYAEFYFGREPAVLAADLRIAERVIRVGSLSKTYAIPGWRLGYAAALGMLGGDLRRTAETMTGGAVAPLQDAVAVAGLAAVDFQALRFQYRNRGERLATILSRAGFRAPMPDGGMYIFAECPPGCGAHELLSYGIAAMPGSLFYSDEEDGADYARFCFARSDSQMDALESAMSRLDSAIASACAAKTERISL